MKVVKMRRGWRVTLTDNEFTLLRESVNRGLATISDRERDSLPYKVRRILLIGSRWMLPAGPLIPDEDRRAS